mgnify:CR=1 FL=1
MLSTEEIARRDWDCLVVGTGIGGATLGHALAKAGKSVLFVEKGRAGFREEDTLRDSYPELGFPRVDVATAKNATQLARAGRCYEELRDRERRFVPLIGCGTGGSSALYGMAMERFLPGDFDPGEGRRASGVASPTPRWPVSYAAMAPYYRRAEALYRVRGGRDPLRPPDIELPAPPALSPQNAELYAHFAGQGLHPYQLPLACESLPGCECCQGYLCSRACKNDASRICLEPALRDHAANLLDRCEVFRIEASKTRVNSVVCRRQGEALTLRARQIFLAAGALMTPAILLRSTSAAWPQGLANSSGLVGRNLMRHFVDLYLVFTRSGGSTPLKEIGLSDFYQRDDGKFGAIQSFGVLPPGPVLAATLVKDIEDGAAWAAPLVKLVSPVLPRLLSGVFRRGILLAAIMEDFPHVPNRVVPGPPLGIDYRLHAADLARLHGFRQHVRHALKPYRVVDLHQAEKNSMLAHVCGTCRFGDDPATSVLDADNRAHGVENLYVVDSSFFPSSGGTNPALTIAANSLRVADRVLHHDPPTENQS